VLAGNVIFPFVPFMIHDFFPTLPKSELGKSHPHVTMTHCLVMKLLLQATMPDSLPVHII
jgi:hypothetical protein